MDFTKKLEDLFILSSQEAGVHPHSPSRRHPPCWLNEPRSPRKEAGPRVRVGVGDDNNRL